MSNVKKIIGIFCFSWVIIAKATRGFTVTSSDLMKDGLHFDFRTFMSLFLTIVFFSAGLFSVFQLIKIWQNRDRRKWKQQLFDFAFYFTAIVFSSLVIIDYL